MQTRFSFPSVAPDAYNALLSLEKFLSTTRLDAVHKNLIKIRASQINGCAFCINMHTTEAINQGMTPKQIFLLNAWREADVYSDSEKAILAFTEQVTRISSRVSDEVYENLRSHFDESYIAAVLMAIITINSWNRMVIATGVRTS